MTQQYQPVQYQQVQYQSVQHQPQQHRLRHREPHRAHYRQSVVFPAPGGIPPRRRETDIHPVLRVFTALLVTAVVTALTVGKAYVDMPGVWFAESHQVRQIRLDFMETFRTYRIWWGPWLNLIGNIALFIPVGLVAYRGSILRATLIGLCASLGIEVVQFIMAAGYSDLDDVAFNTAGALLGAVVARMAKTRTMMWVLATGCAITLVLFAAFGELA